MFNWSRPTSEFASFFDEHWRQYHEKPGDAGGEHGETPTPSPEHQALAVARGLDGLRSPATFGFNLLFKPTYKLNDLRHELFELQNMTEGQPYLAIHLRTGLDFSNDRNRMSEKQIQPSFECVLATERQLGLPNSTKWLIAADYHKAHGMLEDWLEQQCLSPDKVMGLQDLGGVISHVAKDDSEQKDVGAVFAYFDFMMLAGGSIIFGTESGFNRMAAAVSGHEQRVLLPHCVTYPSMY
eukprot:TRINITY_DN12148_c0_g1_i1.p3 TRINITY_DN12148_c0_g1~~TRINITY_DN12148_c0_g1_i1.p3  ORF type:complete len:239 (+),score=47.66 TRINITY_DN12148_c0_g1_i1:3338-4054(+)